MAETNPELNNTIPAAPAPQIQRQGSFGQQNVPDVPIPKKPMRAIILVCLLIIAVAAAGWAYYAYKIKSKNNASQHLPQTFSFTAETKLASSQLPSGFPKDFPANSEVVDVLYNYNGETNGKLVGVREFTTTRSVQEAYQFYHSYFSGLGWTIDSTQQLSINHIDTFATNGPSYASIKIDSYPQASKYVKALISIIITSDKK